MSGRRIAVIGGGISGLTAGYILSRTCDVTVFEADDRLGGHADTHLVGEPDGRQLLASGTHCDLSLGEFLRAGRFSGYFAAHFAIPLVAAVWSCPPGTALRYPAGYLFAFLANHEMLSVSGSPPWRTMRGGSRCHVERIASRPGQVRLSAPVRSVRRHPDGVQVRDRSGAALAFDAAVIATHPDQALRLLDPPTDTERQVLSRFTYTANQAVLHTYHGWGFHEDGCRSGVAAARALGGAW